MSNYLITGAGSDLSKAVIEMVAKPGDYFFLQSFKDGDSLKEYLDGMEVGTVASVALEMAETNQSIQGYHDGIFWERNAPNQQTIKEATLKKHKQNRLI